ncbi:two-component regulator propeller domain-containing protein [Algivirga pacifica]|uniref:two-component regulator propeller domain-containing protein n=1 Tax=Algivirga pacifica TaxID=1162670 RepID=UPI0031E64D5F
MNYRYPSIFLSILLLFSFPVQAQEDQLAYGQLTTADGLTNNHISDILFDEKGFFWIGTNDGLLRYDGTSFEVFKVENEEGGFRSNRVIDLHKAGNTDLLICTEGGGVSRYNTKTERFTWLNDRLGMLNESDRYNCTFVDAKGRIWIGAYSGVYLIEHLDQKNKAIFFSDNNANTPIKDIRFILEDAEGRLWFATPQEIYTYQEDTKTFEKYTTLKDKMGQLMGNITHFSANKEKSVLWVGLDNGLAEIQISSGEIRHFGQKGSVFKTTGGRTIWTVYEDTRGSLWVGHQEGASLLRKGSKEFEPVKSIDNPIYTIIEGVGERLWLGSVSKGIYFTDPFISRFELYTQTDKGKGALANNVVLSFMEDEDRQVWVGTDGGGIHVIDQNGVLHHKKGSQFLEDKVILSFLYAGNNKAWVGTYANGLNFIDLKKGLLKQYKKQEEKGLPSNDIRVIYPDVDGTLWLGLNNGGLSHFDPKKETFENFQEEVGRWDVLPSNSVSGVLRDQEGLLWVSTYYGLALMTDENKGVFKRYFPGDDLDIPRIGNMLSCMFIDSHNNFWVGSYGGGLLLFDHKKGEFVKQYGEKDGLPNNTVYGILEDASGKLWISTNQGISMLDLSTESFTSYKVKDGLQSNEFRYGAYMKSSSGKMYFGGVKGFNSFYPERVYFNTYIPPVALTHLTVGKDEVQVGDEYGILDTSLLYTDAITLKSDQSSFSIEFAALSYINTEKNQYLYKLEGFDKDWVRTTIPRAKYTNIPFGEYTFRVKASNHDNTWNEKGASLEVVILPAYWETLWFKLLLLLIGIMAMIMLLRWRLNRVKERGVILEQRVKERSDLLLEQAKELDQKNKVLDQQSALLLEQSKDLLKQNEELEVKRDELAKHNIALEEANQKLGHQNELIVSGLNYAQTIQETILPKPSFLKKFFKDTFLFYRPKHIVSGDFYWSLEMEDKLCFAMADCTGHGVPGALMSVLQANSLNRFVGEWKLSSPSIILQHLHENTMKVLRQPESGNTDGMDICLCFFEKTEEGYHLCYSGGKMNFFHYEKATGILHRRTTGRKAIGGKKSDKVFEDQELSLKNGDRLFFYTDGYIDQVGEKSGKKLGTPMLLTVLQANVDKPLGLLDKTLPLIFEQYKGEEEQRDDVTVVGLEI